MRNIEVAESFYNNRWQNCQGSNFFVQNEILYSYGHHFIVAMYLGDDYVLLNGDTYSVSTSVHQMYTRDVIPEDMQIIIPFSALLQAIGHHTNYDKIKVIENKKSLNVPYTYINNKGEEKIGYHHTLGGSVFEFNGRYFISGIDDTGVNNNLYFLTELTRPVNSFDDAIAALKPEIVTEAEKNGIEVKRQGEWFFVKTDLNYSNDNVVICKNSGLPNRNDDTGHHIAFELIQMNDYCIVRGIIRHDRKEHKQLKLYDTAARKNWWIAAHNEQIQSWSAGGNVD